MTGHHTTSTDEQARRLWRRIEGWMAANAAALAEALRPGASDDALARAEARMDVVLPALVRAIYRVHEGGRFLAFVEDEMLSLEQMIRTRAMMNDIGWGASAELPNVAESHGPVKPMWWNRQWIPFVGTKDMLCIDLDPAAGGEVGQIVEYLSGSRRRTVVFPSVAAWLEHWAGELEAGAYYFDEDAEELIQVPSAAQARHAASVTDRVAESERLVAALVEARALELSGPVAALAGGVGRVLESTPDAAQRARGLEALFLDSDAVLELFWDSERLGMFLEEW